MLHILPPSPTWDALHPLIIHFPIALLFVASVFVAAESGEAAGKLADRTPEITAAIQHHEELAERTETVFSILTAAFAVLLIVPLLRRGRQPRRLSSTVLPLAFLVFYGAGMLLLTQTADQGGRLVHDLGVHAMMPPNPSAQSSPVPGE